MAFYSSSAMKLLTAILLLAFSGATAAGCAQRCTTVIRFGRAVKECNTVCGTGR